MCLSSYTFVSVFNIIVAVLKREQSSQTAKSKKTIRRYLNVPGLLILLFFHHGEGSVELLLLQILDFETPS